MVRSGFALIMALAATPAAAATGASCSDMTFALDNFLQAHPNATGDLRQTTDAQLMHQPTRASVEKAKLRSREDLVAMLAKARSQQAAGDEMGCRATLHQVKWMLQR